MMKGIVMAAPQSGSGKTTITLGLLAAFTRRGQRVAAFKAGPDFIDPGYHRLITGHPSINLDAWICPPSFVKQTFHHHSRNADIAVIEGVMGLFDGLGASGEGSTAQIASLTGAPVLLVVNVRGMAASAAALVSGFARFDPAVRIAGVIFNNTGGERHAALLARAMGDHCPDVAFLGAIPRDEGLSIPSRHLGLVTAEDNPLSAEFTGKLAETVERHVDLELLEKCAGMPGQFSPDPSPLLHASAYKVPVPIAVASDRAFCFLYEDNLRLMREAGLEPVLFSPLVDQALPEGCRGIYLPGGYPELYARELAENRPMLAAIRGAAGEGMPLYAECGGLIYLTQGIAVLDPAKSLQPLAGIFPVVAHMGEKRAALGYRQVELARDTLLGRQGELLRGHEFHYSTIDEMPDSVQRDFLVSRPGEAQRAEGYRRGSCLVSYLHLHFGSSPTAAAALADACRRVSNRD